MKIKAIAITNHKPLSRTQIQLQVRGKDSGYLSVTTDDKGEFTLDGKFSGQQIASMNGGQGTWLSATEGATLLVGSTTGATQKTKQSTTTK